jgi:hemerythrin-like domain-containing protein
MKATTLLQHQHRNLRELCDAVESGSAAMRKSLLPQLASDLAAHMAVEERVLFPAACEALSDDDCLGNCRLHGVQARMSLHRALEAAPDGEEFGHAISELRLLVARHVEEEEMDLFPKLEAALDAGQMRELGQSMMEMYDVEVESAFGVDV